MVNNYIYTILFQIFGLKCLRLKIRGEKRSKEKNTEKLKE